MIFNPVKELSERTKSLDKIDSVIEELEERQKWLVKYIELKKNESEAFNEQTKLQFMSIQRQLDKAVAMIAEQQTFMEGKKERIVECTQTLYDLDEEKRNLLKLIGELERVELLKQSVALLEQSIFDASQFEKASEALGMIKELQDNLMECEHAKVWIDKAQLTVPKVLKAASEYFKECLINNHVSELRSACKVIDVSQEAKAKMIEWCSVHFLADYEAVYSRNDSEPELVRLCSLDSRLHWFNRTLNAVDQCAIPKEWQVEQAIANRFGMLTRQALSKAIEYENGKSIHSNLKASIKTVRSYEQYLQVSRPSLFSRDHPAHHFLMPSFLPHMHVFVDQQEIMLSSFTSALFQEVSQKKPRRGNTKTKSIAHQDKRYYALSSEQMLLMFRNGLNEIASLSTGAVLGDLAAVFESSLRDYHKYLISLSSQLSKKYCLCSMQA